MILIAKWSRAQQRLKDRASPMEYTRTTPRLRRPKRCFQTVVCVAIPDRWAPFLVQMEDGLKRVAREKKGAHINKSGAEPCFIMRPGMNGVRESERGDELF